MTITQNWTKIYVEDDFHRSDWKKSDLIYLINKYGRKKDGNPPTKTELNNIKQPGLIHIWNKIKPFDFDRYLTIKEIEV